MRKANLTVLFIRSEATQQFSVPAREKPIIHVFLIQENMELDSLQAVRFPKIMRISNPAL